MPEIKVTVIGEPKAKSIKIKCPGCGVTIERKVPLEKTEGVIICGLCDTKLKWEEIKDVP